MASESQPISPARFAEALKELPAETLSLKVLELYNSIALLDYSNAELKPYAEGRAPTLDQQGETSQPDQVCIDAIAENEVVIERMQERIRLVRAEVEGRGLSWRELGGKPDEEEASATANGDSADSGHLTNGVNGAGASEQTQHPAWQDGTFQPMTISQLSDEERELLRQLQSRMPPEGEDEDPEGGMHL